MKLHRLTICLLSAAFLSRIALAEFPLTNSETQVIHPYPALTYKQETRPNPPQKIHVAIVDLMKRGVEVRVSRGGEDPDGPGPWETTLMQPTKVADREHFDVVINGDFFSHLSGKDAEGAAALAEFKKGIPASVIGPAETDGKVWS